MKKEVLDKTGGQQEQLTEGSAIRNQGWRGQDGAFSIVKSNHNLFHIAPLATTRHKGSRSHTPKAIYSTIHQKSINHPTERNH